MRIDLIMSGDRDPRLLELLVDGRRWSRERNRLADYMLGSPLSRWLGPYASGMKRWRGAIEELAAALNAERFELRVHGSPEAAEALRRAADGRCEVACDPAAEEAQGPTPAVRALEEMEACAASRGVRRELRDIRRLAEERPLRAIYDPGKRAEALLAMRRELSLQVGEPALPLAILPEAGDAPGALRAAELDGAEPGRLVVCLLAGGALDPAAGLAGAALLSAADLRALTPGELNARLAGAVEANVNHYLRELFESSAEGDWTDAQRVRAALHGGA